MNSIESDDVIPIIAAHLSRILGRDLTLNNLDEQTTSNYTLYWNGKPTEIMFSRESLTYPYHLGEVAAIADRILILERLTYTLDWFSML